MVVLTYQNLIFRNQIHNDLMDKAATSLEKKKPKHSVMS